MEVLYLIFFLILSYIIGSIPTAVWVGKKIYNIDVREHGSKNSGATNTYRVLGIKAGIFVFIFDVFKGWLLVYTVHYYLYFFPESADNLLIPLIIGIVAVFGHIFPLFAGFRGGKGVATMLGVVIAIQPIAALFCFMLFFVLLILTKYVSLGSIISAIFFPILTNIIYTNNSISLLIFSILTSLIIVYTHKKNIVRLISASENKTYIFKKTKKLN